MNLILVAADLLLLVSLGVAAAFGGQWPFLQAGFVAPRVQPSARRPAPPEPSESVGLPSGEDAPIPRAGTGENPSAAADDARRAAAEAARAPVRDLFAAWQSYMAEIEPSAGHLTPEQLEAVRARRREMVTAFDQFESAHPDDPFTTSSIPNMRERVGSDLLHAIQGK